MKKPALIISLILMFALEISRVYFIMPFPGSQKLNTISFAYWIHNNIIWIRIILLLVVIVTLVPVFKHSRNLGKVMIAAVFVLYGVVFFFFNFRFQADKIFYQPRSKVFKDALTNKVKGNKLVLGVVINGEAKAYPIQLIGYHHQIRDTVDNVPAIVTYCTVCRSGRVFSPEVNGKPETFRLVGMDHFNAMFEDASTKSWWQQATGVAIAGKLKGKALPEIPSEQSTLNVWLRKYPHSLILQPDTTFNKEYESLDDFDDGTIEGELEKRDSLSWKFKSWVIGIDHNGHSRAYDWNMLVKNWIIQDSLPALPLLITLEKDTASFHVFNRMLRSDALQFRKHIGEDLLTDINTASIWNINGLCVEGSLKGEQLIPVQAYQEFWHSWKTFHPNTDTYKK